MLMVIFTGEREAYSRWLEENPGGYVMNAGAAGPVLHRASCASINPRNKGRYEEREKACALDAAELRTWAKRHYPDSPIRDCRCMSTASGT
jgi:hypothetical protein